jgi:hypothetical protein
MSKGRSQLMLKFTICVSVRAGEASSSNQAAGQQGASSSAAGTSKQAPQQQQQQQQSKSLGVNEDGLPMVRGAVCCPFYMGIAQCSFKSACKYHHPRHAMHPECLLQGEQERARANPGCAGRVYLC